jgi:hypothetical protein
MAPNDDEVDMLVFGAPSNLFGRVAFDDLHHHLDAERPAHNQKTLETLLHGATADGGIFEWQTFALCLDVRRPTTPSRMTSALNFAPSFTATSAARSPSGDPSSATRILWNVSEGIALSLRSCRRISTRDTARM